MCLCLFLLSSGLIQENKLAVHAYVRTRFLFMYAAGVRWCRHKQVSGADCHQMFGTKNHLQPSRGKRPSSLNERRVMKFQVSRHHRNVDPCRVQTASTRSASSKFCGCLPVPSLSSTHSLTSCGWFGVPRSKQKQREETQESTKREATANSSGI